MRLPPRLDLWKLSEPISTAELDAVLGHILQPVDVTGSKYIFPMQRLTEVFSRLPVDDRLYIIVQPPPGCEWLLICPYYGSSIGSNPFSGTALVQGSDPPHIASWWMFFSPTTKATFTKMLKIPGALVMTPSNSCTKG